MMAKREVVPSDVTSAVHSSKLGRNKYSKYEDDEIRRYVDEKDQNGDSSLGGNVFWKEMEKEKILPGRSWMSVRDRYLKHLRKSHRRRTEEKRAKRYDTDPDSTSSNFRDLRLKCTLFTEKDVKQLSNPKTTTYLVNDGSFTEVSSTSVAHNVGACTEATISRPRRSKRLAQDHITSSEENTIRSSSRRSRQLAKVRHYFESTTDDIETEPSIRSRRLTALQRRGHDNDEFSDHEKDGSDTSSSRQSPFDELLCQNVQNCGSTNSDESTQDVNEVRKLRETSRIRNNNKSKESSHPKSCRGIRSKYVLRKLRNPKTSTPINDRYVSSTTDAESNGGHTKTPAPTVGRSPKLPDNPRCRLNYSEDSDDNPAPTSDAKAFLPGSTQTQKVADNPQFARDYLSIGDNIDETHPTISSKSASQRESERCDDSKEIAERSTQKNKGIFCAKNREVNSQDSNQVEMVQKSGRCANNESSEESTQHPNINQEEGKNAGEPSNNVDQRSLEDTTGFGTHQEKNMQKTGGIVDDANVGEPPNDLDITNASSQLSPREQRCLEMVRNVKSKTNASLLQVFFSLVRTNASGEHALAFLKDKDTKNVWRCEEDAVILGNDLDAIDDLVSKRGIVAVDERMHFLYGFVEKADSVSNETHS